MKTEIAVLSLIVVTTLSACSGKRYDCANSDVQETVLDAFNDVARSSSVFSATFERPYANDPAYQSIADKVRDSISMSNIVTLQKDDDLGAYMCSATFVAKADSTSLTNVISYEVRKVEDGDSPFAIYYESSDLYKLAYPVSIEIVKPYVEKNEAEVRNRIQSEHDSAMKRDPPISRTANSVLNDLYFTDEQRMAAQVSSIDLNGDSLSDFFALDRQNIGKDENDQDTFVYNVACLIQVQATQPGQVNSLEKIRSGTVQAGPSDPLSFTSNNAQSVDPRPTVTFDPNTKRARIATSDGSAFEFSCEAPSNG